MENKFHLHVVTQRIVVQVRYRLYMQRSRPKAMCIVEHRAQNTNEKRRSVDKL